MALRPKRCKKYYYYYYQKDYFFRIYNDIIQRQLEKTIPFLATMVHFSALAFSLASQFTFSVTKVVSLGNNNC
jgi:hypothetical protein